MNARVIVPGQGSVYLHEVELRQVEGAWWVAGTVYEDGDNWYLPEGASIPSDWNAPLGYVLSVYPPTNPVRQEDRRRPPGHPES